MTIHFHVLGLKVSGTLLPLLPLLSCMFKHRESLYIVLHGLLFGVLGLLVISFYVSYRAVGIPVSHIQTYIVYPVRGEFLKVEHRPLWREL